MEDNQGFTLRRLFGLCKFSFKSVDVYQPHHLKYISTSVRCKEPINAYNFKNPYNLKHSKCTFHFLLTFRGHNKNRVISYVYFYDSHWNVVPQPRFNSLLRRMNYAFICMQGCGALLCDSHNYIKHIKARCLSRLSSAPASPSPIRGYPLPTCSGPTNNVS